MRTTTRALLLGVSFVVVGVLASCTSMITEQQLAEIRELRKRKSSLQQEIKKRESELSRLRGEAQSRSSQLRKCEEDKAFVKAKLAKWPNVWPDYNPNAPKEEENK